MALLVWFTMGIALWHFTVFLPDHFWQGIVGAFVGAVLGSIIFGLIVQEISGNSLGDTDLGTALIAIPGTAIGLGGRLRDRRPLRSSQLELALSARISGSPAAVLPPPRLPSLMVCRRPCKAFAAEPYDYADVRAVADGLGLSEPVAVTLVRRGYRTPEQARAFLAADESHPPAAFDVDGARSSRGSAAAIAAGRRITVHGDFDVDGVCATTIMVSTLRELGADCDWLIPDRIGDGYGAQRRERRDAGRARHGAAAHGRLRDHRGRGGGAGARAGHGGDRHRPPPGRRASCRTARSSTRRSAATRSSSLCGTAVAWKLACGAAAVETEPTRSDLDLVALATVADVVPLVGENRSLVKRGLAEMRRARRPGLRALDGGCEMRAERLDEGDLAFRLAPRINAAGRLYRADAGVELLLTEDEARAEEIAERAGPRQLRAPGDRARGRRRRRGGAAGAARATCARRRGLVLAGEDWHPGVVGIVASRLVERHHRPVVVISLDDEGGGRGCGRSIPGFDLLAALRGLLRAPGRASAATAPPPGCRSRAENLDAFREAFAAHANAVLGADDLRRTERIDAMVGGVGLGLDLAEELRPAGAVRDGQPGGAADGPLGAGQRRADDGGGQARPLQPPQRLPPRPRRRLRPLQPRGRGRGRGRRRGAARGQPLERLGRAARRPARALPAGGGRSPRRRSRRTPASATKRSGGSASRPSWPASSAPAEPRTRAARPRRARSSRPAPAHGRQRRALGHRGDRRAGLQRRRGARGLRRRLAAGGARQRRHRPGPLQRRRRADRLPPLRRRGDGRARAAARRAASP